MDGYTKAVRDSLMVRDTTWGSLIFPPPFWNPGQYPTTPNQEMPEGDVPEVPEELDDGVQG